MDNRMTCDPSRDIDATIAFGTRAFVLIAPLLVSPE